MAKKPPRRLGCHSMPIVLSPAGRPRPSRGLALAVALVLLPLLLVLGMAFMTLSGADYAFSGQAAGRLRAYYLAEAGIRYAYYNRSRWSNSHQEELSLSTGQVRIRAERAVNGDTRVVAVGRSGYVQAEVTAIVDYRGRILTWHEDTGSWEWPSQ